MKKNKISFVAITQREINDNKEIRDSLDRRWFKFFDECGIIPILLPNNLSLVKKIFINLKIEGALLTGGGDIKVCGGKDEEREKVEDFLIKLAIKNNNFPLFGVCRGMQKIQDFFKIKIEKTPNHIAENQKIFINKKLQEVNSYHNFGTKNNNPKEFEISAIAKDGVIKGIEHKKYNISAIMWHPERIEPFRKEDIKLFKGVFK